MSQAMFPPLPRPEVQALRMSKIREVANAGLGRDDILAFWFGESDQPTPDFIREPARRRCWRAAPTTCTTSAAPTCASRFRPI
jgi:aspartate/methionine/tyrosine aminotransferase